MSKHFDCTTCQCESESIINEALEQVEMIPQETTLYEFESSYISDNDEKPTETALQIAFLLDKLAKKADWSIQINLKNESFYVSAEEAIPMNLNAADIKEEVKPVEPVEKVKKPRKPRKHIDEYYEDGKFSPKTYYSINKHKLAVKQKADVLCNCGVTVQKYKLVAHQKTKKHLKNLIKKAEDAAVLSTAPLAIQ